MRFSLLDYQPGMKTVSALYFDTLASSGDSGEPSRNPALKMVTDA
jgi:hypothetical protein